MKIYKSDIPNIIAVIVSATIGVVYFPVNLLLSGVWFIVAIFNTYAAIFVKFRPPSPKGGKRGIEG